MNETNGHLNENGKDRIPERFRGILARPAATGLEIQAAMRWAVQEAIADHKLAGDPIAIWEEGRVVIVPAEEIPDLPGEE